MAHPKPAFGAPGQDSVRSYIEGVNTNIVSASHRSRLSSLRRLHRGRASRDPRVPPHHHAAPAPAGDADPAAEHDLRLRQGAAAQVRQEQAGEQGAACSGGRAGGAQRAPAGAEPAGARVRGALARRFRANPHGSPLRVKTAAGAHGTSHGALLPSRACRAAAHSCRSPLRLPAGPWSGRAWATP